MSLNLCAVIIIPILQVWKLRFRKDRKLTQSHVASQCRPRSEDCNITFSLSSVQWFFSYVIMLLGKPCAQPKRLRPDSLSQFWQYFYSCRWWWSQPWLLRFIQKFCSVTLRKHFPRVRRCKRKPFYSYLFLSFWGHCCIRVISSLKGSAKESLLLLTPSVLKI